MSRQIYGRTDPFYLYMSEIEEELGTVQGVQVNICLKNKKRKVKEDIDDEM